MSSTTLRSPEVEQLLKKHLTVPRDGLLDRLPVLTGKEHRLIRKYINCGHWRSSVFYITHDDEVYAYGGNKFNILGLAGRYYNCEEVERPAKVDLLSGKQIEFIGLGEVLGAALDVVGNLFWWGQDLEDQVSVRLPELVMEGHRFKAVSCGRAMIAALDMEGKVFFWGRAGTYYRDSVYYLARQFDISQPVVGISCGLDHLVAVTIDGDVFTWGSNTDGQRGYDGHSDFDVVKKMDLPEPCTAITCGTSGTWCLLESGELWACGGNHNGPGCLGVANEDLDVSVPEKVLIPDKTVFMMSSWGLCDQALSVALSSNHRIYWWCERMGFSICKPHVDEERSIAQSLYVFKSPHDHMYYVEQNLGKPEKLPLMVVDVDQTFAVNVGKKLKEIQEVLDEVQKEMSRLR